MPNVTDSVSTGDRDFRIMFKHFEYSFSQLQQRDTCTGPHVQGATVCRFVANRFSQNLDDIIDKDEITKHLAVFIDFNYRVRQNSTKKSPEHPDVRIMQR